MTLKIIKFPDKRLRKISKECNPALLGDSVKKIISEMAKAMYLNKGIGLAANQIGIDKRIFIARLPTMRDLIVSINPKIISRSDKLISSYESCLSIDNVSAEIYRSNHITISMLDKHGVTRKLKANGLLSICIQHEIDHLDGILFIDKLSRLKRSRIKNINIDIESL